jgi:hypothetical protein
MLEASEVTGGTEAEAARSECAGAGTGCCLRRLHPLAANQA